MDRGKRRLFRRGCFNIFASDAETNFRAIAANDPDHSSLEAIYAFHVIHGGREGGHQKQIVEIFYGNRPYDAVVELEYKPTPRLQRRLLAESGASLIYERVDNGSALVTLMPAKSERFSRREEMVLLSKIYHTETLTGIGTLERHWRIFSSYMEYTSLDGLPNLADRIRVWWILGTRILIVDGKEQPRLIARWALEIVKFSLTVGLAGFLLEIIRYFGGPPPAAPC